MDSAPSIPDPTPPPGEVVSQDCNCIICGKSLRGLLVGGECPNCRTAIALSLPEIVKGQAPGETLVSEDVPCTKCGRNLRGLPSEGFCPQCRTPIPKSIPVPIAKGQVVPDDRPCLVCGYNLKGLAADGPCPECGTPVARSLRGFLLRYSAPDYLLTLKRGIMLVEVTLGLQIVFGILIGAYAMVVSFSAMKLTAGPAVVSSGARAGLGLAFEEVQQIGEMLLKWSSLFGLWMFTTQDPGLTTQDPGHKARRFLRLFLTISAVTAMGGAVLVFFPQMRAQLVGSAGGMPGVPVITVLVIVGVVSGIAQLVGFIATMNYMAHLSRRVPDAALEAKVKQYRWLFPVIYVFGCGIGAIVALVLYVMLLEGWRKRLKDLSQAVLSDDLGQSSPL